MPGRAGRGLAGATARRAQIATSASGSPATSGTSPRGRRGTPLAVGLRTSQRRDSMRFRSCLWLTATILTGATACGDDGPADVPDAEIDEPDAEPAPPKPVLLRPSKSSTVAISD